MSMMEPRTQYGACTSCPSHLHDMRLPSCAAAMSTGAQLSPCVGGAAHASPTTVAEPMRAQHRDPKRSFVFRDAAEAGAVPCADQAGGFAHSQLQAPLSCRQPIRPIQRGLDGDGAEPKELSEQQCIRTHVSRTHGRGTSDRRLHCWSVYSKHVPELRLGCMRRSRQDTRRKSGSATIANSRMTQTAASAEGSAMASGSAERAAALAA